MFGYLFKFISLYYLLVFNFVFAQIGDVDLSKYNLYAGGMLDIVDGTMLEGSVKYGGLQPDYIIDYSSKEFKELREFANKLKITEQDIWWRVRKLINYMDNNVLIGKAYQESSYVELMKKYREQKELVSLSQYKIASAGVCREHALIFHYALKEAGIPNYHVYVKAYQGSHSEDHALNVIIVDDVEYVVDSYNSNFNGYPLKDLLSDNGVSKQISKVPNTEQSSVKRGIKNINNYPKVYIPRNLDMNISCDHFLR